MSFRKRCNVEEGETARRFREFLMEFMDSDDSRTTVPSQSTCYWGFRLSIQDERDALEDDENGRRRSPLMILQKIQLARDLEKIIYASSLTQNKYAVLRSGCHVCTKELNESDGGGTSSPATDRSDGKNLCM